MNEAIETRELITLDGFGTRVRGTFHRPCDKSADSTNDMTQAKRVGVLFLNSLSLPRAATGDSAVYWADSFAQCGYPSFRIDLPGMGDSDGDLPLKFLDFINSGGYAPVASAKASQIVERFNLSGIVIVGHCAGAVSAIHTAAACAECQGLILMDTYFHQPQAVRPKTRQNLTDWALRSRLGAFLSNIFDLLKDIRLFLRGRRPPQNANFPLLRCWKELASTGLPILIFKAPGRKAPGTKPRTGEFDYLQHVVKLAGRKGQVAIRLIENTDHSFANRRGRAALRQEAEEWLTAHFPLPADRDSFNFADANESARPLKVIRNSACDGNCVQASGQEILPGKV